MTYKEQNILSKLKEEIERTKEIMERKAKIQDFASALRREGEIEGLNRAYSIVCSFLYNL